MTIRRSIESVLSQSYRNIEFVVQDGASTDGTLEILKGYSDPRIKLVSEPDSGPAEAFWKVLNRCQGDIIGTCLSDEELLPGAVEKAVELFRAEPRLGAITCDGYVTDTDGKITNEFNAGEFNLVDYLFGWYCPFWPGSFFRRQALIDVGLKSHKWIIKCLEFEIWCRLGTQHEVKYFPIRMSKYAVHPTQLSNTKQYFHEHFDNRTKVIQNLFSETGFFGHDDVKLNGCLYNQLYLLYNHVKAYKLADQMEMLSGRMAELRQDVGLFDGVRYLEYFNFAGNNFLKTELVRSGIISRRINDIWIRGALRIPAGVRKRIPVWVKRGLRSALTVMVFVAFNTTCSLRFFFGKFSLVGEEPPLPEFGKKVYHEVAQLYYARGQIGQALQLWQYAEDLNDPVVDGLASQAMLMSPTATYAGLMAVQRRWSERYAKPNPALAKCEWRPYDSKRKIRVGYFCSFFDSDTIRIMMIPVIRRSDHQLFEYYGYSPSPGAADIAVAFKQFRVTGTMPDDQFVKMVRADEIDIFVDLSGFSPQHRFAAMASRCAPLQISYLNHTGTSCVPNVDYIFADAVSILPSEDRFFSEKVWRLPGSFLCYNYDAVGSPPVAPPPYRANRYVTFGCFGSGGKINDALIAIWVKILARTPRSRIFIRNRELTPKDNRRFMIDRFKRHGIDAGRIRLEGGTSREEIVKSYDSVDISLDTWPYCGGNTVAEALWQGVPVVTLKGARFSSRYGASLLLAAGCRDLIGETADQYVDIAIGLANCPRRLDHYREKLRSMARVFGLADAGRFARKLDEAYLLMTRERESRVQSAKQSYDRLTVSPKLKDSDCLLSWESVD